MKKLYSGACHCGAVRFEANVDISAGTWKCNCSICAKVRFWSVDGAPGEVHLLQGADELVDYGFNSRNVHHYFCRHCGVRPYQYVDLPAEGRRYYNVNIACLEGVDIDELMAAPVNTPDGLHDRWDEVPDEIRHL